MYLGEYLEKFKQYYNLFNNEKLSIETKLNIIKELRKYFMLMKNQKLSKDWIIVLQ